MVANRVAVSTPLRVVDGVVAMVSVTLVLLRDVVKLCEWIACILRFAGVRDQAKLAGDLATSVFARDGPLATMQRWHTTRH